jgi:hypothetical protein
MFVHHSSVKLLEELRRYKWKMKNEIRTDEPVKLFDDGLSALRYALYTWTYKTKRSNDYTFDIDWIDL